MAYTPPINFSSRLFAKKQTNVICSFVVAKPMYRIFIFYGNLRLFYFDWFLKNFDLCNMFDIEKNWKQLLEIGWQRKKKRKLKPTSFLWFISRINPFILNRIVEFYDPKIICFSTTKKTPRKNKVSSVSIESGNELERVVLSSNFHSS